MRVIAGAILLLLSLGLAGCQTGQPACGGDTPADRAVCASATLRGLQAELASQTARVAPEGRLLSDNVAWNSYRDALCPSLDVRCLTKAYEERIALVRSWGDVVGSDAASIGTAPLTLRKAAIDGERAACATGPDGVHLSRCVLVAYFDLTVSLQRPFTAIAHCDIAYEYETADRRRHARNERHRVGIFGYGPQQRSPQFIPFGPDLTIQEPVIAVHFGKLVCGFNSIV